MGYRVVYRPIKKIRGSEKQKARRTALTALFFLVFLILVNTCWPQGRDFLREVLFPGDSSVAVMALENLADELKAGEGVWDAVENFCRKAF